MKFDSYGIGFLWSLPEGTPYKYVILKLFFYKRLREKNIESGIFHFNI